MRKKKPTLPPQTHIRPRLGRRSLFRGKDRRPVTVTLTPQHRAKLRRAQIRLGLTRADTLALLIDQFADVVTMPTQSTAPSVSE